MPLISHPAILSPQSLVKRYNPDSVIAGVSHIKVSAICNDTGRIIKSRRSPGSVSGAVCPSHAGQRCNRSRGNDNPSDGIVAGIRHIETGPICGDAYRMVEACRYASPIG